MQALFASLLAGAALVGLAGLTAACTASAEPPAATAQPAPKAKAHPEGTAYLVVGAGCFWCPEPVFEALRGVIDVESGYAGATGRTTYAEVSTGRTRWCEVIRIAYDPKAIGADDLLRIFFTVHDPTTKDRQGNDVGPQYRSAIFYSTPEEKTLAERIRAEIVAAKLWPDPIVTTIEPIGDYQAAESYHQDYWERWTKADAAERAGMNDGYCRMVVDPKVRKFREKLADRLKPEYANPSK